MVPDWNPLQIIEYQYDSCVPAATVSWRHLLICLGQQCYLGVLREKCSQALNILDRFHIVAKVNQALDDVRAAEARRMKGDGYEPVLTKSRWCLLKRPENLTANQKVKLKDLVRYNLQSVRAYLLKEDLRQFWN